MHACGSSRALPRWRRVVCAQSDEGWQARLLLSCSPKLSRELRSAGVMRYIQHGWLVPSPVRAPLLADRRRNGVGWRTGGDWIVTGFAPGSEETRLMPGSMSYGRRASGITDWSCPGSGTASTGGAVAAGKKIGRFCLKGRAIQVPPLGGSSWRTSGGGSRDNITTIRCETIQACRAKGGALLHRASSSGGRIAGGAGTALFRSRTGRLPASSM